MHDSVSYLKCCESLSFLVRDVVHVTPENFSLCVGAIRTFVEASYRLLVNNKQNIYLTIIVSLPEEKELVIWGSSWAISGWKAKVSKPSLILV